MIFISLFKYIGAPRFVEIPRYTVIMAGEASVLICSATAIPTPTITWYRLVNNNATMEELPGSFSNTIVNGETLTINNAEYYRDEGYYVCQATNYLQTIRTVSFLKVYGKHT